MYTHLSVSGAVSELNPDSQIRFKLDMLEKSIEGYKDIVSTLERDLQMAKSLPDLGLVDAASAENYEQFRKDMDVLRADNERLARRKEELELMLEHSSLKGAYNMNKFKVLRLNLWYFLNQFTNTILGSYSGGAYVCKSDVGGLRGAQS